jgi:hypothetical protein
MRRRMVAGESMMRAERITVTIALKVLFLQA